MKYLILTAIAGLYLLAGCSSLDVSTDFDPENDFSTYKTYAWFDGVMPEGDALSANPLVKKRAISSVDKELASKGFTIADGDPDFVVIIHAGMKERMQVTNTGYGGYGYGAYGYGRYGSGGWGGGGISDTHVSYYDEATVVVDIADFVKKELVWRGTGTGVLSKSEKTQEESQETADEVIRRIMQDFPPTK
jgi:hypothetical protein